MKKNHVKKLISTLQVVLSCLFFAALIFTSCASNNTKGQKYQETQIPFDSSVTKGILDNEMSYFIKKNAIPANRISLRLVVKAGSAMEEDDQKGVAHFVEHMAFNGTENFAKSEIIDFFEKNGMNFGADLNAYTNFEHTVYMLEIPSDNPELLETAILILKDWASAITFEEEEIEKERGVVTEEWRLRQTLQGRISEKQCDILLKDSVFAERLPIGDMNVIKTVSRQRIVDFYEKWYRPEYMSVIVVGDADPQTVEKAIKNTMNKIPKSMEKNELPEYNIPLRTEKSLTIMQDVEQPYINVFLFNQDKGFKTVKTNDDMELQLTNEIARNIFNIRMQEITSSPDSKWLQAGMSTVSLVSSSSENYAYFVPKTDMFEDSFKSFLDNIDRLINYGVTQTELDREKELLLNKAELSFQNKDKIYNSTYANQITNHVLTGVAAPSEETILNLYKEILPRITVEKVNVCAANAFENRATDMLVIASPKEKIPSQEEINSIWKDYKNSEIQAYTDEDYNKEFMKKPSKKAKISSTKNNKNLGVNEYVLENGIKIITKKTDFERNFMYMYIDSKGGSYKLNPKDAPSANPAVNYMIYSGIGDLTFNQIVKKLQSSQIDVSISINSTSENLSGSCKPSEMETLFQMVNQFFAEPKFTPESWQKVSQDYYAVAQAFGSKSTDWYSKAIIESLYGKNNPYHSVFDMNQYNQINPETAERVYRERFGNPADFTFIFIGDFDEKTLIDNCCYYFGNLNTSDEREEFEYKTWSLPEKRVSETVQKGIGDHGQVYLAFTGKLPSQEDIENSYKDSIEIDSLRMLLDIRLREIIREDKSGSYGISVNSNIIGNKERTYITEISFGCEPTRVEELTDEVVNQIKILQSAPVDSVYVEKLKETYRRSREVNLFENSWWHKRISRELVYDMEPQWVSNDIEKIISWITPESLQSAAQKYLDTQNFVSVYLVPEKEGL